MLSFSKNEPPLSPLCLKAMRFIKLNLLRSTCRLQPIADLTYNMRKLVNRTSHGVVPQTTFSSNDYVVPRIHDKHLEDTRRKSP